MTLIRRCGTVLLLSGLTGCVVSPLPLAPLPLVAVPGPAKTAAEFQQDDVACRTAAASPATAAPPASAQPGVPLAAASEQSQDAAAAAGGAYLHCMESRNNVVQPLTPRPPVAFAAYGYYPSYGPYDGYGPYPWLYDGYPWGGFYRGYFDVGFGGWRGGYGGWHGRYGGGFHGGGRR